MSYLIDGDKLRWKQYCRRYCGQ